MTLWDYLQDRQAKEITSVNEIDALIFNKLTYLSFEAFMNEEDTLTLQEAYQRKQQKNIFFSDEEERFFSLLSQHPRYQNLLLEKIISKLDYEKEEQFMAMCIVLPNKSLYIAYRGTTEELVAWKEDFNMSYMTIPAQKDALAYLNQFKEAKTIYIGGHSKGGNLAMYAAVYAEDQIKESIICVYNYDGPGFLELDQNYVKMKNKIVSYLPSDSIVGRLFKKTHKTIVVKSTYRGLKQHDLVNWQIKNNTLVLSNLSKESHFITVAIDLFLKTIDHQEWIDLINSIYKILVEMGITNIKQIRFSDIKERIIFYSQMEKSKKELLIAIIQYLLNFNL